MPPVPATKCLLALLAAALLGSSCAGSSSAASPVCDAPPTRAEGTLTLSTGVITRAPWVSGPTEQGRSADPHLGRGYDAAVGYALADRLGFDRDQVRWVAAPFAEVLREGDKPFDVNVNQVTVLPDRADQVDLSRPYYRARLAVVTIASSPATDARSRADLATRSLAVVQGSAAETAARDTGARVTAYQDLDEVRRAVGSGAQDAMVVDYITALRLDADETQLVDGQLVGVLPEVPDEAEEFGLVLAKGSALTACVDKALAALEEDGTLLALERRWLVAEPGWRWLE